MTGEDKPVGKLKRRVVPLDIWKSETATYAATYAETFINWPQDGCPFRLMVWTQDPAPPPRPKEARHLASDSHGDPKWSSGIVWNPILCPFHCLSLSFNVFLYLEVS